MLHSAAVLWEPAMRTPPKHKRLPRTEGEPKTFNNRRLALSTLGRAEKKYFRSVGSLADAELASTDARLLP